MNIVTPTDSVLRRAQLRKGGARYAGRCLPFVGDAPEGAGAKTAKSRSLKMKSVSFSAF